MTTWMVRYKGKMTPVIMTAPDFLEAVAKAVEYGKEHNLGAEVSSVEYLAY